MEQDWLKILSAKYTAVKPGGYFKLHPKKVYAEIWMGTHPTTPSLALSSGEDLQKHIKANEDKLVGKPILNSFGVDLLYLPKVLLLSMVDLKYYSSETRFGRLQKLCLSRIAPIMNLRGSCIRKT
jgi:hypothetical protein